MNIIRGQNGQFGFQLKPNAQQKKKAMVTEGLYAPLSTIYAQPQSVLKSKNGKKKNKAPSVGFGDDASIYKELNCMNSNSDVYSTAPSEMAFKMRENNSLLYAAPIRLIETPKPTMDVADVKPSKKVSDLSDDSGSDSGFHDQQPPTPLLFRRECGDLAFNLCERIRALISAMSEFSQEVQSGTESAKELLDELQGTTRTCLVDLDVSLVELERALRSNLDRCTISDERVNWLLKYHRAAIDMRRIFDCIATQIYDNMENVLSVRARGCASVLLRLNTEQKLSEMRVVAEKVKTLIRDELRY